MTEYRDEDTTLRMRDSRAELRAFLGYEPEAGETEADAHVFPQSRLVRALLNERVAVGVVAAAAVVLAFNPALGRRILKWLPWRPLAARWFMQ